MLFNFFQQPKNPFVSAARPLGRSALNITPVGFGLGGKSRAGVNHGLTKKNQIALLRKASALGINYFDTSESYGNESLLAESFSHAERNKLVISSKFCIPPEGPIHVAKRLEETLRQLGRNHIDIYLAHGITPAEYPRVLQEAYPELLRLKQEGKIHSIGLSERFELDSNHEMSSLAIADKCWDVLMIGYSPINPSALTQVLPRATSSGVGIIGMFAVRNVLSQPDRFKKLLQELSQSGQIDARWAAFPSPLDELMKDHGVASLIELGYRYSAYTEGISSMLFGTGNIKHLEKNIQSIAKGPLPKELLTALHRCFGHLNHLSGS